MTDTEKTVQKQHNHLAPYQFKPGQSGNPAGRPKGSRNMSTVFQDAIKTLVKPENGSGDWKSIEEQMILAQIQKALSGDTKAFEVVMNRAYGTPKRVVEVEQTLPEEGAVTLDESLVALVNVLNGGDHK